MENDRLLQPCNCHGFMCRYAHKLPYALVKKGTKAMLDHAHKGTQGRLLGEADYQSWAMEVVQNLPVVRVSELSSSLLSLEV